MRFLDCIYICTWLLLFTGCSGQTSNSETVSPERSTDKKTNQSASTLSDILIEDHKFACIEIGEVLSTDCLDGNLTVQEATESGEKKVFEVTKNGDNILKVYPALDPRTNSYTRIVRSISILSSNYKNKDGISVTSSVSDFFEAYPDALSYYDHGNDEIIMSYGGYGPQFIVDAATLTDKNNIKIGRIDKSEINPSAKIQEIRILRSKVENQDAMMNKQAEEREILEDFLATLEGKYMMKEYSEMYYKIHFLQGEYLVSECREDQCKERGKIEGAELTNGFIPLHIEGIEGEMVPTWTINREDGELVLYVHDYNADMDEWSDKVYYKYRD